MPKNPFGGAKNGPKGVQIPPAFKRESSAKLYGPPPVRRAESVNNEQEEEEAGEEQGEWAKVLYDFESAVRLWNLLLFSPFNSFLIRVRYCRTMAIFH